MTIQLTFDEAPATVEFATRKVNVKQPIDVRVWWHCGGCQAEGIGVADESELCTLSGKLEFSVYLPALTTSSEGSAMTAPLQLICSLPASYMKFPFSLCCGSCRWPTIKKSSAPKVWSLPRNKHLLLFSLAPVLLPGATLKPSRGSHWGSSLGLPTRRINLST